MNAVDNDFFNFDRDIMNYTPTKVGGFWEHKVVFRILHVYSQYLTYGTLLFTMASP